LVKGAGREGGGWCGGWVVNWGMWEGWVRTVGGGGERGVAVAWVVWGGGGGGGVVAGGGGGGGGGGAVEEWGGGGGRGEGWGVGGFSAQRSLRTTGGGSVAVLWGAFAVNASAGGIGSVGMSAFRNPDSADWSLVV